MRLRNYFITRVLFVAALTSLITCVSITHAQQTSQKKSANQDEDVLRIKTELVQTDVTVFDKRGRFVEGLRPEQFELTVDGKRQSLTLHEYEILCALARNAGRVLTRDQLLEQVKGEAADEAFDRSIDVHVSRLRQKIEPDPRHPRYVKTVRGAGYLLARES